MVSCESSCDELVIEITSIVNEDLAFISIKRNELHKNPNFEKKHFMILTISKIPIFM